MTSTSFVVLLLMQVTVISVVRIAMSFAARRNAALRHTIAFLSLTLVVLSPLLTRLLPLQWRGLMAESTEATASIEAARDDQIAMTEPMHPERLMPANETERSVKPDSHPVDDGDMRISRKNGPKKRDFAWERIGCNGSSTLVSANSFSTKSMAFPE